eukprot:3337445-Pleurochrysis_carterae.AAC.6
MPAAPADEYGARKWRRCRHGRVLPNAAGKPTADIAHAAARWARAMARRKRWCLGLFVARHSYVANADNRLRVHCMSLGNSRTCSRPLRSTQPTLRP